MLLLIVLGAMTLFFLTTFTEQWGGAVGKRELEDASPKVKAIKGNYLQALNVCPAVIKKLNAGIPELEKQGKKTDVLKSYKLIYDCQIATKQYSDAVKSLSKLIAAEPQVARWHGLSAEALFKAKSYAESLRSAHLASQLEPENAQWLQLEAQNLIKLNMPIKAAKLYKQAIAVASIDKQKALVDEFEQVQTMLLEQKRSETISEREAAAEELE